MRINQLAILSLVPGVLVGQSANASIDIVIDNPAGFASMADSSFQLLGQEDFEDNTVADGDTTGVGTALSDSTSSAAFPNGISVPVDITSNSGIRATRNRDDVVGTVVGAFSNSTSLDLNFDEEEGIKAVGFNPITPFSDAARFSIFVSLHDGTNTSFTLNPVDAAGTHHLGLLTDPGDSPVRIVTLGFGLINGTVNQTQNGLDNLGVYITPEPTSLVMCIVFVVTSVALTSRCSRATTPLPHAHRIG